ADPVALSDVGIVALRHADVTAVVHAHAEPPCKVGAAIVLLDLMADRAARYRAADCRRRAAVALADRRAEQAARDRADRCARADVRILVLDLLHAGHGAAVAAAFVIIAVARKRASGADHCGAERHRDERVAQLHGSSSWANVEDDCSKRGMNLRTTAGFCALNAALAASLRSGRPRARRSGFLEDEHESVGLADHRALVGDLVARIIRTTQKVAF